MIHGVGDDLNNSAIEIPMPIELPAWNEAHTRKTPIPHATAAGLPHFFLTIIRKETSEAIPILAAIAVKMIIKKIATTTIHNRSNPKSAPNLEVIVTLLGPKTSAAVIMPGPSTPSQFLNLMVNGVDEEGVSAVSAVSCSFDFKEFWSIS